MALEIPLGLKAAIEDGNCVLFVGAGIGGCARGPDGRPAPRGDELALELASHFGFEVQGHPLAKVAQYVEVMKGRRELVAYLSKRFAGLEPDEHLRWIATRRWRAIYTTNYDSVLERCYGLVKDPPQTPVVFASSGDAKEYSPLFEVPIYHLHGALESSEPTAVVITEDDYTKFRERRRMLFEDLKRELVTGRLLYLGYSNQDPNWRLVSAEVEADTGRSASRAYRVARSTDALDRAILESKGITSIDASLEDFVDAARSAVSGLPPTPATLQQAQKRVPAQLAEAFASSPAATLRLLKNWEYVNQADFGGGVDANNFLKGDRPTWGTIDQRVPFIRDLEEPLFQEVLEYATSSSRQRQLVVVLGSAGSGITTLLMMLAHRLVEERVGPVFALRQGATFNEADIEFAASLFPEARPIFVVDQAARFASRVAAAQQHLRESKRNGFFLLGERRNQWFERRRTPSIKEFALEWLSDAEIDRLLTCLETHGALGVLLGLDPELRFAAVKQKHDRQLLVAMREATEGKAFDAIIESEYHAISASWARELYMYVCVAYQHRLMLRDSVVAAVMKRDQTEVASQLGGELDGVLDHVCIDEDRGIFGIRARHSIIAEIVWERCSTEPERYAKAMAVLSHLNLTHQIDADLFWAMIRSEHQIDSLGSLEQRTKFFEAACRKEPGNAYVHQHYARMLHRARVLESALLQAEEASRLDQRSIAIQHTRGIVLRDLALDASSDDVARKWLAKSEAAFKEAMARDQKDAYQYQSLAELYLGWAGRVGSGDEATLYLEKAEEVVGLGLLRARERDGLWIVSSKIDDVLGKQPDALVKLERAVKEGGGDVVAGYLLSRAYFRGGEYEKAAVVCKGVLEGHPNEHRVCMVYAETLIALQEGYGRAVSALRLGELRGRRDPRFVAMLGGVLFLDRQFTESVKIFADASNRFHSYEERTRVRFRPRTPAPGFSELRLAGKVTRVGYGSAHIGVPGYPEIRCRGTKFGRVQLRPGLPVEFSLGFSADGAVAERVLAAPPPAVGQS